MAVALFDTNILIDFLKGYKPAIDEIEYWDDSMISSITRMEPMVGAGELPEDTRMSRSVSIGSKPQTFNTTKVFLERELMRPAHR